MTDDSHAFRNLIGWLDYKHNEVGPSGNKPVDLIRSASDGFLGRWLVVALTPAPGLGNVVSSRSPSGSLGRRISCTAGFDFGFGVEVSDLQRVRLAGGRREGS